MMHTFGLRSGSGRRAGWALIAASAPVLSTIPSATAGNPVWQRCPDVPWPTRQLFFDDPGSGDQVVPIVLEGDDRASLIVSDDESGAIWITHVRNGMFAPAQRIPGVDGTILGAVDVDGDGDRDLIVLRLCWRIRVVLNTAGGLVEGDEFDFHCAISHPYFHLRDFLPLGPLEPGAPERVVISPRQASGGFPMLFTFRDGAVADMVFLPIERIRAMTTYDGDDDGLTDLVSVDEDGVIRTVRGLPDGAFVPTRVPGPPAPGVVDVHARDLDGDGNDDLVLVRGVEGNDPHSAEVRLGQPGGGFSTPIQTAGIPPAMDDDPMTLLTDVDGDGHLDLLRLDIYFPPPPPPVPSEAITIARGRGDGTFEDAIAFPGVTRASNRLVLADVDGDGADELVKPGLVTTVAEIGHPSLFDVLPLPLGLAAVPFDADLRRPGDEIVLFDGAEAILLGSDLVHGVVVLGQFPAAVPGSLAEWWGDDRTRVGRISAPAGGVPALAILTQGAAGFGLHVQSAEFGFVDLGFGDLTGDGRGDAALLRSLPAQVEVMDLSVTPPVTVVAIPTPKDLVGRRIDVADFDGDGRADLMLRAQAPSGRLMYAAGRPDGGFEAWVEAESGAEGFGLGHVIAVDFDGDGRDELVEHREDPGDVRTLRRRPDGSFLVGSIFVDGDVHTFDDFGTLTAADVDGDGDPDLLEFDGAPDRETSLRLFRNQSTPGVFVATERLAPSGHQTKSYRPFTTLDFDADGTMDLLVHGIRDRFLVRLGGSCPSWCLGDADRDGTVDFDDVLVMLPRIGTSARGFLAVTDPLDLDANRAIDLDDLLIVLGDWGGCSQE